MFKDLIEAAKKNKNKKQPLNAGVEKVRKVHVARVKNRKDRMKDLRKQRRSGIKDKIKADKEKLAAELANMKED